MPISFPGNQDVDLKRERLTEEAALVELDSVTADAIHKLVTLVHDHVSAPNKAQAAQCISFNKASGSSIRLEDDPVAKIFGSLDPLHLQQVIISMAVSFYLFITFQSSELFS